MTKKRRKKRLRKKDRQENYVGNVEFNYIDKSLRIYKQKIKNKSKVHVKNIGKKFSIFIKKKKNGAKPERG